MGKCVGKGKREQNGADEGTRTLDLRFTKPLLYRLSYIGALLLYDGNGRFLNIPIFPDPHFRYNALE